MAPEAEDEGIFNGGLPVAIQLINLIDLILQFFRPLLRWRKYAIKNFADTRRVACQLRIVQRPVAQITLKKIIPFKFSPV